MPKLKAALTVRRSRPATAVGVPGGRYSAGPAAWAGPAAKLEVLCSRASTLKSLAVSSGNHDWASIAAYRAVTGPTVGAVRAGKSKFE